MKVHSSANSSSLHLQIVHYSFSCFGLSGAIQLPRPLGSYFALLTHARHRLKLVKAFSTMATLIG
jgi:hypothetical protein